MNKLIRMATIVAGVGAMLSFAGCGSSEDPNSPEAVAKEAIAAELKGALGMVPELKVGSSDIKGDNGVVNVDAYVDGKKADEYSGKVDVIKVNGKWTVKKGK